MPGRHSRGPYRPAPPFQGRRWGRAATATNEPSASRLLTFIKALRDGFGFLLFVMIPIALLVLYDVYLLGEILT